MFKVFNVSISRWKSMTSFCCPNIYIGESFRIGVFYSPISCSINFDFKEMLKIEISLHYLKRNIFISTSPFCSIHIAAGQPCTRFWHWGWHSSIYFPSLQFVFQLEWILPYWSWLLVFCLQLHSSCYLCCWSEEVPPIFHSSDCDHEKSGHTNWKWSCKMDPKSEA